MDRYAVDGVTGSGVRCIYEARPKKGVEFSFSISVYLMVKGVFWALYYNNIPTANATNIINT